ncbi:hypothetical protein CYMTET_18264 [Cymbomonas tetramitiformis]|uniref:Uncharacterized protein n=1 Tax=Cymbomonas tetramitiformis TaxID=36881 RepID=A0AAE0G9S8_9CHLO|nr:hypothetical protein CYMTET_18264 [Cymbomonas tetramitiformis]
MKRKNRATFVRIWDRGTELAIGGDEILIKLIAKIDRIENFIKTQRTGGAAAILPKRARKGLAGFRAGSHPDPHVGFEGNQRKALPKCPRCPMADDGHKSRYGLLEAGSTAAYCQSVDDCLYAGRAAHPGDVPGIPDRRRQRGSDIRGGVRAIRWWMRARHPVDGVAVSAYGFAVSDSEDSDGEDMDMEAELQQLRREVSEAARGVRLNQASFIPQVSMESAANRRLAVTMLRVRSSLGPRKDSPVESSC